MNWQKWVGFAACILLIGTCFMHWAYYPDLQKHFTGFDTRVLYKGRMVNYYGRPGVLLSIFASICLVLHLTPKIWAKRFNLFFAAFSTAYAVKSFLMFSASYDGFKPDQEAGLWLMLAASIVNLAVAVAGKV